MDTSPARKSARLWGYPCCLAYVSTKVHCRPLRVRKYFFVTRRPDFFGCLRVAQDHRLLKMAVSTLMKVALLTTCLTSWSRRCYELPVMRKSSQERTTCTLACWARLVLGG